MLDPEEFLSDYGIRVWPDPFLFMSLGISAESYLGFLISVTVSAFEPKATVYKAMRHSDNVQNRNRQKTPQNPTVPSYDCACACSGQVTKVWKHLVLRGNIVSDGSLALRGR